MNIVFLVTHIIMALCTLSIMYAASDSSIRRVKREKKRAVMPVLAEEPAPLETDFKKKTRKHTPTGFKPNINQEMLSKSSGFRYDLESLN